MKVPTFANEAGFSRWLTKKIKKRYPDTLLTNVTGTGYGKNGVHDIILCHYGAFLTIELKMPNKPLTKLQDRYADKVFRAKGMALAPCYPTQRHVEGVFFFLDEIERGFKRREVMQSLSEEQVSEIVAEAKAKIAAEATAAEEDQTDAA